MFLHPYRINLLLTILIVSINLVLSGSLVEHKNRNSISNLENSEYGDFFSSYMAKDDLQASGDFFRAALSPVLANWFESGAIGEFIDEYEPIEGLSETCQLDMKRWVDALDRLRMHEDNILEAETWVLQMVDAWGKIPAGILSGHINSLGDWDECVELNGRRDSSNFRGRYCTAYIVPHTTTTPQPDSLGERGAVPVDELLDQLANPKVYFATIPSIATCWPSSCSKPEIGVLLDILNRNLTSYSFQAVLGPADAICSTIERPELTAGNIVMIIVLSILAALCISATFVDVLVTNKDVRGGLLIRILVAFSLYTNAVKCVSTKSEAGNLGSLHGIRFFSTCWVIIGHSNLFYLFQPFMWNTHDLNTMYEHHWTHYALLNGFYSVDTFFAMSGMLACFGLMRAFKKAKGRVNIPMLYLHRYLRITPTYALLIGLIAAIFPLIGRGPWWALRVEKTAQDCIDGWWKNLLYIQNFWSYNRRIGEEMCQGESWYIANDMQFFIVMPFFVYLIYRWRNIGFAVLAAASVGSILVPGIVTYVNELPPVKLTWQTDSQLVYDIYDKPWYRIGPYLAGIVMGYILYKTAGKPVKLPYWAVALGWTLSTGTACALIFGIKPYYDPNVDWSVAWSAVYAGVSRYLWACCVMWIVFACQFGYGGWVNDFLSWKVFMPLGRLTFCVYISSTSIQELLHYQVRYNERYAVYPLIHTFFGHVVACFLVGFLLTVTMESPFIQLEKIAFGGMREPAKKPPPTPAAVQENEKETKATV